MLLCRQWDSLLFKPLLLITTAEKMYLQRKTTGATVPVVSKTTSGATWICDRNPLTINILMWGLLEQHKESAENDCSRQETVLLGIVSFLARLLNISLATCIHTVTFSGVVKTIAAIHYQFSRSVLFAENMRFLCSLAGPLYSGCSNYLFSQRMGKGLDQSLV